MTSYAAHAKAVVLTIERNGTMAYRFRAARQLHRTNSLPIFSVDTEEEAQMLLTHFCKRAYDNETYLLTGFEGTLEAMEEWGQRFALFMKSQPPKRTTP